jgi:glycine/D-amino acid oxidase-like deaminating enzyme
VNRSQLPPSGPVFWLEQALAEEQAAMCPPVTGTHRVDVCIVGGGYTGLWAAIELKELAPEVKVAVIEAEGVGFGASGRNGGWMTSWYDELDGVVHKFGEQDGLWLADESSRSIDSIEAFVSEEGIECDFRRKGSLYTAGSPAQLAILQSAARACRELGRGHQLEELTAEQVAEQTGAHIRQLGGVFFRDSASVQPARLVRGLRRAALRRGVQLFEGTRMLKLERSSPAAVATSAGRVEADQVIVATNAWAAQLRELRRAIVVVGTQIVLTEPMPERVSGYRWSNGTLLGDGRLFVHYAQVTVDGRIAFGRGGGAIGPMGRVLPKHFADPASAASVAADFREWFPQFADAKLTHAWGGPVDRAPGHLPFVGSLGAGNIHYGVGYSGNGVGPSRLIGRILARRALAVEDELSTCRLVSGPPGYLPPEPLRFAGGTVVRRAVRLAEEREEAGRVVGPVGRLAKRLVYFSIPPRRRFGRAPKRP